MFLGNTSATDDIAPLEHENRAACTSKVGRRDQPVVPASDDNRVVLRRSLGLPGFGLELMYCVQSHVERSRVMYPSRVSKKMMFQLENSRPEAGIPRYSP